MEPIDIGLRIKQWREIRAKIKAEEDAFEVKMQPLEKLEQKFRAFLLQYLNDTNQRAVVSDYGGIHKLPKSSFRVIDKAAFQRHVIGAEAWELLSWACAPAQCEAFTTTHNEPPPGLFRNAWVDLGTSAPPKAHKGRAIAGDSSGAHGSTVATAGLPEEAIAEGVEGEVENEQNEQGE